MNVYYLASFDPMHYGHQYVYKKATELFGPVKIVICKNALKTSGMFTLEERKEIIINDYGIRDVLSAENEEEIKLIIKNADKIVRGVRTEEDREYISKLLDYYQVTEHAHKLHCIGNPQNFIFISSKKLKNAVMVGNIEEARRYAPDSVIQKIQNKLGFSATI